MKYITENNLTLTLSSRTNSELLQALANSELVKPQVPQYYHKVTDTYIPNPDHPDYRRALEVYDIDKILYSTKLALTLAIDKDEDILSGERKKLKYRLGNTTDEDIWYNYLYNTLATDDITNIINSVFLTENKVYDIFNIMVHSIYRGGSEILNARLKNGLNSQIRLDSVNILGLELVHSLDEYLACIQSNIDWTKWKTLSIDDRAEIIALYRINKIVESHSQDEMQIEIERKSK